MSFLNERESEKTLCKKDIDRGNVNALGRRTELCLSTNNENAMRLYKKLGFHEKACLQCYTVD